MVIKQITAPSEDVGFVLDDVKPTSALDAETEHNSPFVQAEPVYRPQAVNPHVGRGTVLIDVTTDKHGHVRTAIIKESAGKTLDDAALQAALQWEFTPSLMKGIAVPGWATLRFKF
jgi:TonB family protein